MFCRPADAQVVDGDIIIFDSGITGFVGAMQPHSFGQKRITPAVTFLIFRLSAEEHFIHDTECGHRVIKQTVAFGKTESSGRIFSSCAGMPPGNIRSREIPLIKFCGKTMLFLLELRFRERFFGGDHGETDCFRIDNSTLRKSHFCNQLIFPVFQGDINTVSAVFFMIVHGCRFQSRERFPVYDQRFQLRHSAVPGLRIRRRRTRCEKNKLTCPSGNGTFQNNLISFLPDDFPIFQSGFRIKITIITMISAHIFRLSFLIFALLYY